MDKSSLQYTNQALTRRNPRRQARKLGRARVARLPGSPSAELRVERTSPFILWRSRCVRDRQRGRCSACSLSCASPERLGLSAASLEPSWRRLGRGVRERCRRPDPPWLWGCTLLLGRTW